jgi:hypothetical protein
MGKRRKLMVYYVHYNDCNSAEPYPGWYYIREDKNGNEKIFGPFLTKYEANEDLSEQEYSRDYKLEDEKNDKMYFDSNGWD